MQSYLKHFYHYHGLTPGDFIACAICGREAVDIHHICREHHQQAHGLRKPKLTKEYLLTLINGSQPN